MQKATLLKRKSILCILVGAALLCGLGLLISLSKDSKPQFATKAGESKAFRFSYVSEGSGKTSGEFMLPGLSEATDSQVSAAWSGIIRFKVDAAATEFTDLLMEITSASFEARLNQSTLDPVPTEIQGRVRLDLSGRIKYYAFPKAVMDTHGSFLSEIIRFLDLKLPSDREAVGRRFYQKGLKAPRLRIGGEADRIQQIHLQQEIEGTLSDIINLAWCGLTVRIRATILQSDKFLYGALSEIGEGTGDKPGLVIVLDPGLY